MVIAPRGGEAVGKVLLEIGKALGKAVVAGIGLELARAATHQVKRVVGPKGDKHDKDDKDDKDDKGAGEEQLAARSGKTKDDTAADIERIRRENAALREELDAIKRELRKAPVDTPR